MLEGKEWTSSEKPPKANTQCKAMTLDGIDMIGEAWYDSVKWWYWPKDSNSKFGLKNGFVIKYIPLYERLSELVNNKYK